MAAQHPGREGPQRAKVPDVVLIDLVERAVARVGVVAAWHDPLVGVFRELDQLVIGIGCAAHESEHGCQGPETGCSDRLHLPPSLVGPDRRGWPDSLTIPMLIHS